MNRQQLLSRIQQTRQNINVVKQQIRAEQNKIAQINLMKQTLNSKWSYVR